MPSSLAEVLTLIRADLPAALVSPDTAHRLAAHTDSLMATARTGFECRLGAGLDQIDLQQGITRGEAQAGLLHAIVAVLRPAAGDASAMHGWDSLRRFADEWIRPASRLHQSIEYIWLEYDVTEGAPSRALPSFFAVFAPDAALGHHATPIEEHVLSILRGADESTPQVLRACRTALPEGARVSHVGLMLGRTEPVVRTHINRLPPASFADFPERLGWRGDAALVRSLSKTLSTHCDHMMLCFDAGDTIGEQLGLECLFAQAGTADPRWPGALDALVDMELCTAAKRQALLAWPGMTQPAPERAWPAGWIIDSLTHPATQFGVAKRSLSHVKVSVTTAGGLSAKAYFGVTHHWLER